jgi:hypothetical protein
MAEIKTNTDPNQPTSEATNKGSTTPTTAQADSKPAPFWKRYGWPVALGTGAAFVFSAPLLGGAALGAVGRLLYEKWKSRHAVG